MAGDTASVDRYLEEAIAEQARLSVELEELHARALAADAAKQRSASRIRAALVELTEAARAELQAIEAEHR